MQIKGTTLNKKLSKKNSIKHPVQKDDLEVYYRNGSGVLYIVVTINPNTYAAQAFYKILAPLDLKHLLIKFDHEKKQSSNLSFKKLRKGALESICKQFVKVVEKQPSKYIDASSDKEFSEYKVDYIQPNEDTFNLFEDRAYIYGIENGLEIPVTTGKLYEIRGIINEKVILEDEILEINYEVRDREDAVNITIENSLVLEICKKTSKAKIHLSKVKSLISYQKSLKIIKYLRDYDEIPLRKFDLKAKLGKKGDFKDVEQDISIYEELIKIFNKIGINEDYIFSENEDISKLFDSLFSIFKDKEYNLLTDDESEFYENVIHTINLSDYVKVMLLFDREKNEFIDFFSDEALNTITGLIPKEDIENKKTENANSDYWKVSIYSTLQIKAMQKSANYKFETIKRSFNDEYHDIKAPYTINVALEYIKYFDGVNDHEYLDFANNLVQRYLNEYPEDIIAKINWYQIKVRKGDGLSEKDEEDILDILEKSEREKEKGISFACELLLGNKSKAKRLFKSLGSKDQNEIKKFPIYNLL